MAAVEENEWQAVSRTKQKKKKVEPKPFNRGGNYVKNGENKHIANGRPNKPTGPAPNAKPGQNKSQWRGRPQENKPLNNLNGDEEKAVEKGSWAAIVKKDVKEAPKVEPPVASVEEPAKVVEESKGSEEKAPENDQKTFTVADIEAELRLAQEEDKKEDVVVEAPKEEAKKEPKVKPGFSMTKKLSGSTSSVADLGKLSFGSNDPPTVDLKSLVENFGKEVVDAGTSAAIVDLRRSLDDTEAENRRLKQQLERLESQFSETTDALRSAKLRLEELNNAASENENYQETIAKLTKQLEQQSQKRSYYDESPSDGPKQHSGPPPPELHYPQQMYPPPPGGPMGYYHGGFYPYPNYQQSPPTQRYGYDHPPPPGPGPNMNNPNQHYGSGGSGNGGHDDFGRGPPMGGMNMRRRDMDKNVNPQSGSGQNVNQPPPGYGGNYQYPTQPYVMQQQGYPGQNQNQNQSSNRPSHHQPQGWTGGRQ